MKPRRRYLAVCVILPALASTACSTERRPASSEIEQTLTSTLPAFARVSSFSVEAMQNMGTQVEPVWHSRFRATITVTVATFVADGYDPGIVFVRAVKPPGATTELFGKSVSTLYGGEWRTQLDLEGQPIHTLGQPESAFGPQTMILRGSQEEATYLAEQAERRRLAVLAADREAEERRLAAERARNAPLSECYTPCTMHVGWAQRMTTDGRDVLIKFSGKSEWLRWSPGDNLTLDQFRPGEAQFASPDGLRVRVSILRGTGS